MIERCKAKSGQSIVKYSGRYICSSVNPQSEAAEWVEKRTAQVAGMNSVIVVGVGCGYHIAALRRRFTSLNIVAVDTDQELIDFTRDQLNLETVDVKFVKFDSTETLTSDANVQAALGGSYIVLRFAPSTCYSAEEFNLIECTLLARNRQGFDAVLACRKRIGELVRAGNGSIVTDSKYLISIKNLYESLSAADAPEGLLVRALKELVN